MNKEEYLTARVGILEETVSALLSYLKESSNSPRNYLIFDNILKEATDKVAAAERVFKTDSSYVK